MRKTALILGIVTLGLFVSCKKNDASSKVKSENVEVAAERDNAAGKLPIMDFETRDYDFGTIEAGTPVETVFRFTNTGNAPLIITNATSSCGCTVPSYPKDKPIAPGETGELLVKFNGSGKNQVTKTVTVTANTQKGTEYLTIKAFVNAKDGTATPIVKQQ
ncbi:DUF1573 domain-containing protein [Leptobacterium sp. I13]|uniref:DUF1573 domain-containing protein n=1 Tax=Leptobacterium meishanense TaxID=3128904 RepID=UPI0030EE0D85